MEPDAAIPRPPAFEPEYVAEAVEPFLCSELYAGERPALPMIDLALSKENAIDPHVHALMYGGGKPDPDTQGVSVFTQRYERRGPDNARKRIYMTATTPDLVRTQYRTRIAGFFDRLFADANAGRPLMRAFEAGYPDLFWGLHLGATDEAIPPEARIFTASFNAVLGWGDPTTQVVHEHYMRARASWDSVKRWIEQRVQAILDGGVPGANGTFVRWWLANSGQGADFRRSDIVIECFHDVVASSQWAGAADAVMRRLEPTHGDPTVRSWFERTMSGAPDGRDGGPFSPLDRFVMELFRTISPNAGSLSTLTGRRRRVEAGFAGILTPHRETSRDPRHWSDPDAFDPDRYLTAPTSADADDGRCRQAGLARCPFPPAPFEVKDGRRVVLTNSVFGAVYSVVDGEAWPVCDAAGFAPFGFGYRRCPAEHLNLEFVKEMLRTVWRDRLCFVKLDLPAPDRRPGGPGALIDDDMTFRRR